MSHEVEIGRKWMPDLWGAGKQMQVGYSLIGVRRRCVMRNSVLYEG
jgi:hypothetical protein